MEIAVVRGGATDMFGHPVRRVYCQNGIMIMEDSRGDWIRVRDFAARQRGFETKNDVAVAVEWFRHGLPDGSWIRLKKGVPPEQAGIYIHIDYMDELIDFVNDPRIITAVVAKNMGFGMLHKGRAALQEARTMQRKAKAMMTALPGETLHERVADPITVAAAMRETETEALAETKPVETPAAVDAAAPEDPDLLPLPPPLALLEINLRLKYRRIGVSEAARLVNFSKTTVHKYLKSGDLTRDADGYIDPVQLHKVLRIKSEPSWWETSAMITHKAMIEEQAKKLIAEERASSESPKVEATPIVETFEKGEWLTQAEVVARAEMSRTCVNKYAQKFGLPKRTVQTSENRRGRLIVQNFWSEEHMNAVMKRTRRKRKNKAPTKTLPELSTAPELSHFSTAPELPQPRAGRAQNLFGSILSAINPLLAVFR